LEFKEKLDQNNLELRQNMKQFLDDFNRNPEKLIEIFKEKYDIADDKVNKLRINWKRRFKQRWKLR
jgi:hypothetical protein